MTTEKHEAILIDDGRYCNISGWGGIPIQLVPDLDSDDKYDDFVTWAMKDAIENHWQWDACEA